MSFENKEQRSNCQHNEMSNESQKKSKILYTREFLLSLSGLDVCQNLPSGLDQSILSEFEDTTYDQQKTSGSLSSTRFRRSDYGSSPPSRGDSTSHSWGNHGRWESPSSGRSDKDSDSQSDWDSDSGRWYSNQSKLSRQGPEHDGLLGSGSFPRSSDYAAGVSMPKFRPNGHYQLNKSNEPYHPPRPYKAPHSRHTHDSFNNETFGSSESTSEDKVEEERKRRESFELMRKEQHEAFQEKQKLNLDRKKDNFDIATLLEESKDAKRTNRSNTSDEYVAPPTSDSSSKKFSFLSQTSASRPVVPPGFASTMVDKNLADKSLNHSHPAVGVANLNRTTNALNETSGNKEEMQLTEEMGLSQQQDENMSSHSMVNDSNKKVLLDGSTKMIGAESNLYQKTNNSETMELNVGKVIGSSILRKSNEDSTSILDKLFGSNLALKGGGSSSLFEKQDSKAGETWSPDTVQSSKFAPWFHEEENKPTNDLSSDKPNDILSLIVGGEKDGSRIPAISENSLLKLPFQSSVPVDKLASNVPAEHLFTNNKPEAVSAVLTCEDLEQSILSEIGDNGSSPRPSVRSLTDPDGKTEQPKASIDDIASQCLLSLLQKGNSLKVLESFQKPDAISAGKLNEIKGASTGTAPYESRDANVEKVSDSANTLTLETLFGTAFMKELQSVGAPVSVQKTAGSLRVDVSEPPVLGNIGVDDALHSSNAFESNASIPDSSVLTANRGMQIKTDKTEEQWLNFVGPSVGLNTSQLLINHVSKGGGFGAPSGVCFPEEDSLISVSDPLNAQNFVRCGSLVKNELLSSQTAGGDISEKLWAKNSVFKDGRYVGGSQKQSFLHGPYDAREPDLPCQNFNVQPSSAQIHHPQMHNVGPFHPFDSHPPPNHQLPANILRPPFHHPNTGLSGLDRPVHHPMLQQMYMPGNLPPHLLQGMSRGPSPPHPNRSAAIPAHPNRSASLPAHPNSQVTGFMQEVNPMPGFPFGHRQQNFSSLGIPQRAPDVGVGSNHPHTFQRLMEMELRSNAKQIRPYAGGGHSQGMYGHELDMGFGYR